MSFLVMNYFSTKSYLMRHSILQIDIFIMDFINRVRLRENDDDNVFLKLLSRNCFKKTKF